MTVEEFAAGKDKHPCAVHDWLYDTCVMAAGCSHDGSGGVFLYVVTWKQDVLMQVVCFYMLVPVSFLIGSV